MLKRKLKQKQSYGWATKVQKIDLWKKIYCLFTNKTVEYKGVKNYNFLEKRCFYGNFEIFLKNEEATYKISVGFKWKIFASTLTCFELSFPTSTLPEIFEVGNLTWLSLQFICEITGGGRGLEMTLFEREANVVYGKIIKVSLEPKNVVVDLNEILEKYMKFYFSNLNPNKI